MTTRAVVRHVRYWRGNVHRWSTVYQFVGTPSMPLDSAAAELVRHADDVMCYGKEVADGGTYECQLYNNASGGVPIATSTTFDWEIPADWIKYSSFQWSSTTPAFASTAEQALAVEWAAGFSSSGKPVKLRKWYHATPESAAGGGAVQILATDITSLTAGAVLLQHCLGSYGLSLGSASGRLAGSPVVLPYFGSHQMPRGRRRPALVSADGRTRFPAGLLTVPGSDGSLDS